MVVCSAESRSLNGGGVVLKAAFKWWCVVLKAEFKWWCVVLKDGV